MRLHLSHQAIRLLYSLRAEGAPLWAAIEEIRRNPEGPAVVMPGRREVFVRVGERGYWVIYRVEQESGETVVRVTFIEQN
jgi:hypothetical protein